MITVCFNNVGQVIGEVSSPGGSLVLGIIWGTFVVSDSAQYVHPMTLTLWPSPYAPCRTNAMPLWPYHPMAMTLLSYHPMAMTLLYYKGEVIGFRLFRATGLAFAIRPKDGVARQGRRGGFHCYCSKACWNNFSIVVRVRGRATGLVFASCPKDCFARQGRRGGFHFYRY